MAFSNWQDKENAAKFAKTHTLKMEEKYAHAIEACAGSVRVYSRHCPQEPGTALADPAHIAPYRALMMENTWFCVENRDTVSAIMKYGANPNRRVAVLNFASYTEPGGKFLDGSIAQEESLCRESFLYNVLSRLPEYYAYNSRHKEKALYLNRAVYTPGVLFQRGNMARLCDVITCAAPNRRAAQKYCHVTETENSRALRMRVQFLLDIACLENAEVLILGAFGCDVFGQDPEEVAKCFLHYLNREHVGIFKSVVFAVPRGRNPHNYEAFAGSVDRCFRA